jgi:hypothetical protein
MRSRSRSIPSATGYDRYPHGQRGHLHEVLLAPVRRLAWNNREASGGLLAPLGQLHKSYDGEPCPFSKEKAAEDELRAHDRHLIAAFWSAHSHC